ncbi:serine/threonine-protein kinase N2 [Xenopus tropicalis]|uniref:Serine/threonine-protein kinase N2 n=1 Tax=Xenopus tropicalis TaxID=8364 RepID=A0A8J1ISU4_XENTR|nr:serine/threonine-protein kinase N2 [Xenopus tropicalis]XP_031748675.1 serine/threonine-protein kinase N2 [Xenopus tropicalis]
MPRSLENFNLGKVLGEGTFGKVFLAEYKDTKQLCAIKTLKKERIIAKNDIKSVFKEKRILQKVTSAEHPFLVSLYATFQSENHLFFVMEYLPGGDLCHLLEHQGAFEESKAMFYTACIVLGLEELHRNNIVHRDLKLENLMVDVHGYLKIVDFGLSKDGFRYGDRSKTRCGTNCYMAPEIIDEMAYSRAVDWWALGVVLYVMIMFQFPFDAEDDMELFESIRNDKPALTEELSEEAQCLILRLLEKNPCDRLGYSEAGAEEVKAHEFFEDIDWEEFLERELMPPFKPDVSGLTESTRQSECQAWGLMPPAEAISPEAQELFEGFDYSAE